MNDLQKVAGVASIVQAAGFVVVLLFLLVLLPGIGIRPGDLSSPNKVLPVIASPVLRWYYALFLVFGLTVVVTLGVYDRLQGNPPALLRIALAAAVASAVFWIGYGMFGSTMVATLRMLNGQNQALSETAFVSAMIVINGLFSAAPFAGSWNILLWGWAVVATRKLPAVLGYIVVAAGLLRLLTYVVPSRFASLLNLVQLLLSIIWGLWLGVVLLQG